MEKKENNTVATNKKAYHDYFVLEKYEAGIELFGTEVPEPLPMMTVSSFRMK